LAPSAIWRRVRHQFSISAPRMAVRTHLPWPWRAAVLLALVATVAGMWWWGFDFGQIFSGFDRKETEARLVALTEENVKLNGEAAGLRARNSELESELAMTRGSQATLTRQSQELAQENSQIKEELAFLQKLVVDSNKLAGVAIQRLTAERERDDTWRYSLLLVRGGSPRDEFQGQVSLQATLAAVTAGGAAPRQITVNLPEDQPATAAPLALRFKYYQRVEGTFQVPPGAKLASLTARVFEGGATSPRATRTLTNP
jgi:hypothetical protein